MKKFLNPDTVHSPVGAYSHQVEISGPQRWLVIAGQIGMQADGTLPDDPTEQFANALDNISRNLQAASMGVPDLVKLTFYLVDRIDTAKRRELFSSWAQGYKPCTTLIYVAGLATPDIKVEIEAWACA